MTILEKVKKLDSSFKQSPTSLESFEETYRTAYSHGLENIYQLETVDIKTVRPIQNVEHTVKTPSGENRQTFHSAQHFEQQLELDLGEKYRDWMEPFLLREPIQVLGLSQGAESCLLQHEKCVLGALIGQDLQDFVFLKGMGQGYIDETQNQLEAYVKGYALERSYSIVFKAWLRSLTMGMVTKKVVACFDSFGIEGLLSLSPAERVELRCIDTKTRQEWIDESIKEFRLDHRGEQLHKDMKTVVSVFVVPWMQARGGIVSKHELVERMQRVSDSAEIVTCVMEFFRCIFNDGSFPLKKYLYQVENDVFCCDPICAEAYPGIIQKSLTYFYKPDLSYKLFELVGWISREYARGWQGFPENFLTLALRRSSKFRVRKGGSGHLEIRLS